MIRVLLCFILLLLSSNTSAQWTQQSSGTSNTLYGVSFLDANLGMAVGDSGTILRTTNGGSTWMTQSSGTKTRLRGVFIFSAAIATVVGDNGTILRTTNGGAIWTVQAGGKRSYLQGVFFSDAMTGIIVGGDLNGNYQVELQTTNGGATWIDQSSGNPYPLCGVSFSTALIGTAVGGLGTVAHTINGGITWHSRWVTPLMSEASLVSVAFTDTNNGTAVGPGYYPRRGLILHTTDGGATWSEQVSGTTQPLSGVAFTDTHSGTAVGDSGTIVCTINGVDWTAQASGTTSKLNGICFTVANTGIIVGANGTILRSMASNGVSNGSVMTPSVSIRSREVACFPNPFATTTMIRYSLASPCTVSLNVYNTIGERVRTTDIGFESAGKHSIVFDASDVSEGFYYYRISAGNVAYEGTMMMAR